MRHSNTSFPEALRYKQWCCVFDAAAGRLIGRARSGNETWVDAADGAILHPAEVVDDLLDAGLLKKVRSGRFGATQATQDAVYLPRLE